MLIKDKPVKVGDRVAIARTNGLHRFHHDPIEVTVEIVGRKYITANGYKFNLEGRDESHDPRVFELWNSLADYQEDCDRNQLISKIRSKQWQDLEKLPTESLRTLLALLSDRQC